MKFNWFIGIDVSKKTLDICVRNEQTVLFSTQIENSVKALKGFLKQLKSEGVVLNESLFCMEHTGIYCTPLMEIAEKVKIHLWLENATAIKLSNGLQRGKNDQVDALRIAEYAFRYKDKVRLFEPPREIIKELKSLVLIRKSLQLGLLNLQKLTKEKDYYSSVKSSSSLCKKSITALKQNLAEIESKISVVIKSDPQLKHLFEIVTSIKGIGNVVGIQMILTTNEFKNFTCPKKYACYAGVAPFEHLSGTSIKGRPRLSRKANMSMKALLHMTALGSVKYNEELRNFFNRRVAEGKSKMSVLNMVRNKLIHRVFACVRDNRKYENSYINSLAL